MEPTALQIILLVSWIICPILDYTKTTRDNEIPAIYIPAILTFLYGGAKVLIFIVNGTI